jgi:Asp-tRNA(Asn)/Glu-tRNA(Gln) amidotransferase A subunit family amidase
VIPASRELRDAREQAAGALAASGARIRRVELPHVRRALELYLTTLQEGAGTTTRALIEDEAEAAARLSLHRLGYGAVRRRGPHTVPLVILLGADSAVRARARPPLAAGAGRRPRARRRGHRRDR